MDGTGGDLGVVGVPTMVVVELPNEEAEESRVRKPVRLAAFREDGGGDVDVVPESDAPVLVLVAIGGRLG